MFAVLVRLSPATPRYCLPFLSHEAWTHIIIHIEEQNKWLLFDVCLDIWGQSILMWLKLKSLALLTFWLSATQAPLVPASLFRQAQKNNKNTIITRKLYPWYPCFCRTHVNSSKNKSKVNIVGKYVCKYWSTWRKVPDCQFINANATAK